MEVCFEALAPARSAGSCCTMCRVPVRRNQRRPGALGHRRAPACQSGTAQGAGCAEPVTAQAGAEGRRVVDTFSPHVPRRDALTLLMLPRPSAVVRADLAGQQKAPDAVYKALQR